MSAGRAARPYRAYQVLLVIYAITFFIVLYAPLVTIGVLSFNDTEIIGFPIRGFTTRWYGAVLENPQLLAAFLNSILLGITAAFMATGLALLLAMAFRRDFRLKGAVLNLILAPVVVPGIVGGIILLIFFGYLGMRPSLWTTVLVAHVNWVLPFAFLTLYPRLHSFDTSVEEAAMDLGARRHQVFLHIVFPMIRPAVIATMLFSFSLSFDEFIRTIFVIGFDRTMPIQFWTMIVEELAPELPAMAVMIIVVSSVTAMLGFALMGRNNSRS